MSATLGGQPASGLSDPAGAPPDAPCHGGTLATHSPVIHSEAAGRAPTRVFPSFAMLGTRPFGGACPVLDFVLAELELAKTAGSPAVPQALCRTPVHIAEEHRLLRMGPPAGVDILSMSVLGEKPPPAPNPPGGSAPLASTTRPGEFRLTGQTSPAPGTACRLDRGGTPVAIFNVDGTLYAIDAVCPHAGGPLDEGEVEDGKVTCPWHGSVFDLRTGAVETPPAEKGVTAYSVRREGGDLILMPRPT